MTYSHIAETSGAIGTAIGTVAAFLAAQQQTAGDLVLSAAASVAVGGLLTALAAANVAQFRAREKDHERSKELAIEAKRSEIDAKNGEINTLKEHQAALAATMAAERARSTELAKQLIELLSGTVDRNTQALATSSATMAEFIEQTKDQYRTLAAEHAGILNEIDDRLPKDWAEGDPERRREHNDHRADWGRKGAG